jgi:predicted nuclease of restriction endonuclease-like (RecB) superfamily
MIDMKKLAYTQTIKQLKSAILASRYRAATLANRELLTLYFNVGKLIDEKTKEGKWGDKILMQLSDDLQKELPGLKGFSATNLKNMRAFFEYWNPVFSIGQSATDQLKRKGKKKQGLEKLIISQSLTDQFSAPLADQLTNNFFKVSFTHHTALIPVVKSIEETLFYLTKIATEFWSVITLKHHLKNKLFRKKGMLPNNFSSAIQNENLRAKALQSFKDEYLLDFINIEDPDEEDERMIENEIVRNIKKFLMSLGADFAFIANQYRVIVESEEFFTDLLFFNRKLQCLVAFDLKKGKFKPEYAGKMNFYLSALDESIKQPHELPAIGIILCKEKTNRIVEFSFRDMTKPMGVATYKTSSQLPKQFKNALPNAETLKKLMG